MQPKSEVGAIYCEDSAEPARILGGLRSLYRPNGPSEEFLVEQMAHAQWNIRRYQRTLTGLIEYQTALTAGRLELERKQDMSRTDPEIQRANTLLMGAAFHFDSRENSAQLRLHRMLLDLDRQYCRALKNLFAEQARRAKAAPAADHGLEAQQVPPQKESEIPAGAVASIASAPRARLTPTPGLGPRLVEPIKPQPFSPSVIAGISGFNEGIIS